MRIEFTSHANEKIKILGRHGVKVTRRLVEEALLDPERVVLGLGGRQIAERCLDDEHTLRVVFIKEGNKIRVVTLYPARRGRY